jgi:hypothetical protein
MVVQQCNPNWVNESWTMRSWYSSKNLSEEVWIFLFIILDQLFDRQFLPYGPLIITGLVWVMYKVKYCTIVYGNGSMMSILDVLWKGTYLVIH